MVDIKDIQKMTDDDLEKEYSKYLELVCLPMCAGKSITWVYFLDCLEAEMEKRKLPHFKRPKNHYEYAKPKVVSICEKRHSLSEIVRVKKLKRIKTKSKRFWVKNQNCLSYNMNRFKFLTCHTTK